MYKKIIAGDFHIPKFVSPSAKNLIQGILTTDPNRRFSIRSIKNHEWFREVHNREFYIEGKIPIGIKASSHLIPVDDDIVEEVTEVEDASLEEIRKYVTNNRHNHTVAIYYLLLKKNLRKGKHSNFDITSSSFDPSLLKPRHAQVESKKESREGSRRESVELDRTTTATGDRSTSRAVNRINLMR